MKNKFIAAIVVCFLCLTACKHSQEYVLEGTITGLAYPSLYIVTDFVQNARVDTILTKEGNFKYSNSSKSLKPVIIYMEDGSVWATVWAQNGDTIHVSGDAACPELIEATGNEINDLLTEFKQANLSIIQAKNDSVNTGEMNRQLIQNSLSFIQQHPASVASLVLIQDYLIETEDTAIIAGALGMIESAAQNEPLYARLQEACQQIRQNETTIKDDNYVGKSLRGSPSGS